MTIPLEKLAARIPLPRVHLERYIRFVMLTRTIGFLSGIDT
jgi:hypothetical protein